ncbi:MAG: hypothetical protein V4568_05325 [Pseudomonadota bacterium]
MRDPEGGLEFRNTEVIRHLYADLSEQHFLKSEIAQKLVENSHLIDFQIIDEKTISSPRISFITYPYEWVNAQLVDAAALTLDISEAVFEQGWELKDGSAWNIVFQGTRPLFCDHLSFQKIEDPRWWAFAQYVRHFLLPLCLSRYRGLDAKNVFRMARDGLSPDDARSLMGSRRFATRYWPLMLGSKSSKKSLNDVQNKTVRSYHQNLYALTRWLLDGVSSCRSNGSHWIQYTKERDHYTDDASRAKQSTVKSWLEEIRPAWVIDFGCNTGEFSLLAKAAGAKVVAIDIDHDSVQSLYLSCSADESIFLVVADLDDLSGGRGWGGEEFPGLVTRLTGFGDVTMMLALIHHLAISSAIPYEEIARLAHKVTKRALIVELLDETDPLVKRLCSQRRRLPPEFSFARQHAAFSKFFRIAHEIALPGGTRRLALMEPHEVIT